MCSGALWRCSGATRQDSGGATEAIPDDAGTRLRSGSVTVGSSSDARSDRDWEHLRRDRIRRRGWDRARSPESIGAVPTNIYSSYRSSGRASHRRSLGPVPLDRRAHRVPRNADWRPVPAVLLKSYGAGTNALVPEQFVVGRELMNREQTAEEPSVRYRTGNDLA
jgi:hypothetical protein